MLIIYSLPNPSILFCCVPPGSWLLWSQFPALPYQLASCWIQSLGGTGRRGDSKRREIKFSSLPLPYLSKASLVVAVVFYNYKSCLTVPPPWRQLSWNSGHIFPSHCSLSVRNSKNFPLLLTSGCFSIPFGFSNFAHFFVGSLLFKTTEWNSVSFLDPGR